MFYKIVVLIFRFYFFFILNIKVKGIENIPSRSAAILVANHPSLLDGPLLAAAIKRRLYPFAKVEVFNTRIKRWFLKRMGGIPVRFEKFSRVFMIETEKKLRDNNLLLIFPEGKINRGAKLGNFNAGFVKLAQKYNVPIIPIAIRGREKSLSKNDKMPEHSNITITISAPIFYGKDKLSADEIKTQVEIIKEKIESN